MSSLFLLPNLTSRNLSPYFLTRLFSSVSNCEDTYQPCARNANDRKTFNFDLVGELFLGNDIS